MDLHALLRRQLKRLGIDAAAGPSSPGAWSGLLERVSRAYEEFDQERYLLERSQALAVKETEDLNAELRRERDWLDRRVHERTDELMRSERRLSSLLSLSAEWIWEQDAQLRFTFLSEGVEATLGMPASELIGREREIGDDAGVSPAELRTYREHLAQRRPFRDFTYRMRRRDGQHRYIRVSGAPLFDAAGTFTGYHGVASDVTAAVAAEQRAQELAQYDSLTGLPNRTLFLADLERAILGAKRRGERFAVCFLDLDRFKTINDTLGHAAGDELLAIMARRLRDAVRANDVVARLGGDEFVVRLDGCGDAADLMALGQKVLAAIAQPVVVRGVSFLVTGSVGIGIYPSDGQDAATLLQHADAAMYLAKERGKNNVQFYTGELAEQAARQFETESALRLALVRNELLLHYQPKLDLATGTVCGMEALVRWQHPARGLVPPSEFIPLAEERGLIVPLGQWVLRAACRQMAAWRRAGLAPPPVAINLSARQFIDETLLDQIRQALAEHDLRAGDLEVEITESALMAEPERANAVLHQLHALGVQIAIDDFGTGYSSLSYLKRFPAQTVKIDRSFVRGLPADADDTTITQAVIAMAHSLGLRVVAEGVETTVQLDALKRMACDEVQGYLIARPLPAEDMARRFMAVPTAIAKAAA